MDAIVTSEWTTTPSPVAIACARGWYQRSVLRGTHRWSGSDLCGRARDYGAQYARSRRNLVARLRAAGIDVRVAGRGIAGDPLRLEYRVAVALVALAA